MKKSFTFLILTTAVISGCVSNKDFQQMQSQVFGLQTKVERLEGQLSRSKEELAATKGELAVVKEQRLVRLPTGAPTEMRQRQTAPVDAQTQRYNDAVAQYKSGDVAGAIGAFEAFVNSYPNAAQRGDALFYLGQAAYTVRDFSRAQQALEPLVFQPVNGQINEPAARLLKMVYQAQGNSADEARLNDYLQTLSQPAEQPNAATEEAIPAVPQPPRAAQPAPQNSGVIIEQAQPLRPALINQ